MSTVYNVKKILVPALGFKARTQALCLAQMGVSNPGPARQRQSTWELRDASGNSEVVVFLIEGSKRADAVSTIPVDGEYIIEEWEKFRGKSDIKSNGGQRYTFVRRLGKSDYEFMGKYKMKSLFWDSSKQEILGEKGLKQKTLWERI